MKKCSAQAGVTVRGIAKPALKLIMDYSWPGNVRQLESVIERGALMAESDLIQPEDLPAEITEGLSRAGWLPFELPPDGIQFDELERNLIIKAMERADWVIAKAAPLLGMSYKTLQYRLEKFEIGRDRGTGNGDQ